MGGGDATGTGTPEEEEERAAAAYDYEGMRAWPPHLAPKPKVLGHFRREFYQRYVVNDRDLVV